jgi:dihydrofolate reductase
MLSMIVAMGENRVIGVENRLPWHIPEDLKRFKQITKGHPIIMGRKTFESIGKPLPGRTNIVITRNKEYRAEGIISCSSLKEAMEWAAKAPGSEEIFVIGGAEIFKSCLDNADRIYLTLVKWPFDGDTYLPDFNEAAFQIIQEEELSKNPVATLKILERKTPILDWQN